MAKKKKSKKTHDEFSLDPVREQVDKAQQLAGWVEAAFEHRAKFPPQVVLAVVGDYLVQWDTVGPDLAAAAAGAGTQRETLIEKAGGLREKAKEVEALVDELKLRHVIGELSADEFDAREKEARGNADSAELATMDRSIADVDAVLDSVGAVQARLADAAEMLEALKQGGEPVSTPAAEAADQEAAIPEPVAEPAAAPTPEPPAPEVPTAPEAPAPAEPVVDAPSAIESSEDQTRPTGEEWDVPAPTAASEQDPSIPEPALDGGGAAETPPVWSPLGGEGDADAPGASAGEDLMSTGLITARPDLMDADAAPPVQNSSEFKPEEAKGEGPRLAVFSPDGKQETYPFGGEVMSMGRGRNNDIQIKNDGKISRYHCRIFRRGDEFIIEDNKSSNGTLVDSKLVTRQRLDGGEQIQIGETRVIFQL
jgi:hypothetical protein